MALAMEPVVTAQVEIVETQSKSLSGWAPPVYREGDRRHASLTDVVPLPGWEWGGPWQQLAPAGAEWLYGMPLSATWSEKYRVVHTVRRRVWGRIQCRHS